ncbi:CobW family GTP-binding protein [Variovorax boronicumulans]|uniref:CobW family GTP-binding protein n=1 Tax=Variovorax boronicumulans TaxID=436515 RepID=UPI001C5A01CE
MTTPTPTTVAPALPVTLLGGYLGAGKTTLVNHLLRAAHGRRIAVLVNDFGDLGIDGDLIEAREGDVITLAGGCVCCSFGSDLMDALQRLRQRIASLDHVLIETSGVALPASVASTVRLVEGLRLNAVVVLADANAVRQQASDRYVGETVQRQLEQADLVVLNKLDLLGPAPSQSLRRWATHAAPQAFVLEATRCQVAPELLFDMALPRGEGVARRAPGRSMHAKGVFRSISFAFAGTVDTEALSQALLAHADRIVRAKGLMRDAGGAAVQLQFSGTHCTVTAWQGKPFTMGRLVCIGPAATWNETLMRALVWPCAVPRERSRSRSRPLPTTHPASEAARP